jgi:hypothetical protein
LEINIEIYSNKALTDSEIAETNVGKKNKMHIKKSVLIAVSKAETTYVLLAPHMEGTLFINEVADKTLVLPGGTFEVMMSQKYTEINKLVASSTLDHLSQDMSFPAQIKKRGMDKASFPTEFPYRDDGMLIWNAIKGWVESYLAEYYLCDADVVSDNELQSWIRELRNQGRVQWLKGFDDTIEMLNKLVTSMIFNASAQHAAIHFTQSPYEGKTFHFNLQNTYQRFRWPCATRSQFQKSRRRRTSSHSCRRWISLRLKRKWHFSLQRSSIRR